jgi:23S rRNA pseudouridine1911/1915/1917 synthase
MSESLLLSVPAPSSGERLDRFLARAQTDLSRSRLQALIRDGCVRVNGRPGRASQRLRGGDRVQLELPAPDPARVLEPEARPLAIPYEDEHLLVVDKPAGLVVHPGAGVSRGTLVHALLHHAPGLEGVGGTDRPGIVHRLDKDTSGLLVVAKTPEVHRALVEALERRAVIRVYAALVWGAPRAEGGEIDAPIGRDPRARQRMAVVRRGGRPARTRWSVRERFGLATLLDVRLDTGRTHQIRVHLAHRGFPVVGDPVYGGRSRMLLSLAGRERSLAAALLRILSGQALHAAELAFEHPVTGEARSFHTPLPETFARALVLLRASASGRDIGSDHAPRAPS